MKLQIIQDFKNHGFLPPINFNPGTNTAKNPDEKQDYLQVEIYIQPVETNS